MGRRINVLTGIYQFHVKQRPKLFADAELAKDRIEHLFDVDTPGKSAHIMGRRPQSLCHQFQFITRMGRRTQQILYTG